VFDNPGTLTENMSAAAVLTASDGASVFPYENSLTQYYEVRRIVTEAGGPVLSSNLLRHASVSAGEALLTMGSDTIDGDIRAKQSEIEDAVEKLEESRKALDNFNAVAPIDGTVTTCNLTEGAEVKSGDTVIIISNNTTMLVNITVDDRNISFVKPGMTVERTDWNGNVFVGLVSSINTGGAEAGQGMTNYPVTLTVDNYGGTLMEGVWLDYSFVASQSDDCLVVPMQSVKYVSDEEGNTFSVVFIKTGSKPENAAEIDIPEPMPGETPMYPSQKEGYFPVPVTTGLSDNYSVEIKEGLEGGEEVFVNYYVTQAWG
ncbi:MAG: HlyD family efflux transporter periplasmic adaptor subunit, partial [Clostridiales bacterium]|nr:HlyD family efflux transporter periplasmic adaptor subunit [Clostridiales bacterium]